MLSTRVFGEDITKPHTASLKPEQAVTTKEEPEDVPEDSLEATEEQFVQPGGGEEEDLNA